MKRKIYDERLVHESNKQNSLGFACLYFGLLIILIYRQFILNQTLEEYSDIAILFFGVSFLVSILKVFTGVFAERMNLKRSILISALGTIVFTVTSVFVMKIVSIKVISISVIVYFIVFNLLFLSMQYISSKKNNPSIDEGK